MMQLLKKMVEIISKPIYTFKSNEITNNDRYEFNTGYWINLIVIYIFLLLNQLSINTGYERFITGIILTPIFLYIFMKLTIKTYFAITRIFGKGLEISYNTFEIIMIPYLVLYTFGNGIAVVISNFNNLLSNILQLFCNLLIAVQVFSVLRFSLNQREIRCFIATGCIFIFNILYLFL